MGIASSQLVHECNIPTWSSRFVAGPTCWITEFPTIWRNRPKLSPPSVSVFKIDGLRAKLLPPQRLTNRDSMKPFRSQLPGLPFVDWICRKLIQSNERPPVSLNAAPRGALPVSPGDDWTTQKNLEPPWPENLACVLSKIKNKWFSLSIPAIAADMI